MLRCAILKRVSKDLQPSYRRFLLYQQSLTGISCHQKRQVGFLPIVSSHDLPKKESSWNTGFGTGIEPKITRDSSHESSTNAVSQHEIYSSKNNSQSTIPEPQTRGSTKTSPGVADADPNGGFPAEATQFSASLADGTIVHLKDSLITLSHFKDLVLTISQIWKQHSDKIIPQLFVQNVGISIHKGIHHDRYFGQDALHTTIYDAGVGRGPRRIYSYLWSVSADRTQFSCLQHTVRSNERWAGRKSLRKALMKALKNYIGSVDQHGSLELLSSPVSHACCSRFEQYERCFAYDTSPSNIVKPMSIILDEHAVISPVPDPDAAVTREELLSLAAPIWQWWRRERPLVRENVQNHITNIRIMYVARSNGVTQANIWKMSLISDVSLSRSVHQIFVSNIDGSFKSSVIESTDELEILRPGTDKLLRDIALVFLKNNIGWIDSAGSLKVERYPKYKSLVDNIKGRKPTSAHPQASLSLGNSTAPEPEASSEGKGTGLDDISGGGAVAESKSDKREQAQHATSEGNQRSRDENATRVKKRNLLVSATLPDGTLVIPSFKLCQEMDKGVGKSFSFILQIISQWRAQSRNDLKHEYHRKASLVYVFPKASESSFNVEIFRKESNWFDQPMTRYKLYHAPSAEGCLYVDFKPLSGTVLDRRKLGAWKNVLLDNFRFSLRNHVGVVDQAGV
ncbi:uncharacterized protein M437DRAFT_25949, partial [Aureobasidium melanogenum CBS 110374]